MSKPASLYLAGGCFWGTEHYLRQINGVLSTQVGYANGHIKEPTYEQVCTGETGFAEAVRVTYDPDRLPLTLLVQLYFQSIDPTAVNRQGGDVGTQYRTGIYYTDSADLVTIEAEKAKLAAAIGEEVMVEVEPLKNFFFAEEYHEDYLIKNPNGYCHIPQALFELAKMANAESETKEYVRPSDEELREKLTPLQYEVTQENATEVAFTGEYDKEFADGIYVDITTGEPLFLSTDKFDAGCGWPAFSKPIDHRRIVDLEDLSRGRVRTEVRSAKGDAHLGHVFRDGIEELGGLRYCINSAALRFVPREEMEAQGYGSLLPLLATPGAGR